jgi:hypothetical protein
MRYPILACLLLAFCASCGKDDCEAVLEDCCDDCGDLHDSGDQAECQRECNSTYQACIDEVDDKK